MARHYYRTNVPLPVMLVWWAFLGICCLIYGCYDVVFVAPGRNATQEARKKWDRDHFNGWQLQEQPYEKEHGLFTNKRDGGTCTISGYPGYSACPEQRYFIDGQPQDRPPKNLPEVRY